jgi:hypothetical protein
MTYMPYVAHFRTCTFSLPLRPPRSGRFHLFVRGTSCAKLLHESIPVLPGQYESTFVSASDPPSTDTPPTPPWSPIPPPSRNAPEQAPPGSARRTARPLVAVLPIIAEAPPRPGKSQEQLGNAQQRALGETSLIG